MLDVPPGWRRIIPAAGVATLLVYHVAVLPAVQAEIPGRPCTVEVAFNEPWGRSMVHRSWDVGPGLGSVHQLRQLAAAVDPGREAPRPGLVDHPFWNKRLRQVPWLAGIMLTLLGLAWTRPAGAVVRKAAVLLRPLRVCGRVALRIYVFHLVVLAAVVTAAGRARHGPWPTLAVTAGVFLGCWGFAELSRVRRGTKFFPARKQVSP
ncbi:MAG: OpgC domain-containing protein [Deltaproteobacteria bacterium]|nr:OpgC domain-containing protein [Deltaproteobacteria bacterium]